MYVRRRLSWLVLVLAAGGAYLWWRRRADEPTPEWPPFDVDTPPTALADPTTLAGPTTLIDSTALADPTGLVPPDLPGPPAAAVAVAATWVAAVEGVCPLDHPVKANGNSRIYHVPGGRFYDRTRAERCYAGADDAEADGYRAAKA